MTHAAQMARALDREVLNLGFCGRAWCEPVMAEALARIDPLLYLVDCLPNNSATELTERLPKFLQILRQARPHTPIMLVEDRLFGGAAFQPQRGNDQRCKNHTLHAIIDDLRQSGMQGLHLAAHPDWFGTDGDGTFDASHPNDLGAYRMAQALTPIVDGVIGGNVINV